MTDFRAYLSLFWSFCSIPAAGLYLCMMLRCAALSRSAGSDSATPGTTAPQAPLASAALGGRLVTTEPLLIHRPCDSFPAPAVSWGSPRRIQPGWPHSLPVLYLIWSPWEACPAPNYSRSVPQGSWCFLINLPDHSYCHITMCSLSCKYFLFIIINLKKSLFTK